MRGDIEGRTALVTGGGRGIGRAIALALAGRGVRTALVSRTATELESVAAEIADAGGRAAVVAADLSEPSQIGEAVHRAAEELGPVEILVNNAGVVWPLGPTAEVDPLEWEAAFQVNVFAVMRMTQAVLPGMVQRGWGRIVDVSSGVAITPDAMISANAYAASKAALEAHVVNLAAELDGSGVTVNGFRPGVVDTAMQGWIREQDPSEIDAVLHERFVGWYENGELLTPEASASSLLKYLRGDGTGEIWNVT